LNILAIDTAADTFSAGISTERGDFCFCADAGASHSEMLFDAVDALVNLAKLEREDIDFFACMKGPGSFTGLRIGFAAVKGLAFALGKRMISVPTLDCMAYPFSRSDVLCVPVLDAKQRRFFAALYRNGGRLTEYLDCTAEELAVHICKNLGEAAPKALLVLTGSGADLAYRALFALLPDALLLVDVPCSGYASQLLRYIKEYHIFDSAEDAGFSAPLYIRKSDAEIRSGGSAEAVHTG
jgi:tRNA threonylcarbamoyladenosine biosynthesis protein TsaB